MVHARTEEKVAWSAGGKYFNQLSLYHELKEVSIQPGV